MATGQEDPRQQPLLLQHVVAVPIPGQGHLNSLMRFCKLLAKHPGFIVTFVDFDPFRPRLQQVHQEHRHDRSPEAAGFDDDSAPPPATDDDSAPPSADAPHIRRASIPIDGLDFSNDFNISFRDFHNAMLSIAPHLEQLIISLNSNGPPVTCLLSDFNVTRTTQVVADKLGIPRIVLYPFCASMLLFNHYLSHTEHNISIQRVMEALATTPAKRGEVFAHGVPGLPTMFNEDIPHFQHMMNETQYLWEEIDEVWQLCDARAHAVVVNSFMDLEEPTFRALSEACTVPIYDVGLWAEPLSTDDATSLWKEDTSCMAWLERQRTASVLYISFGSMTLLSSSQLEDFEDGLIASEQPFLWVFRPGLVHGIDDSSYAASVMSKSHGRGFVVSWAPQWQVLGHPSVGGFLTHCGWNSTTESIINGVPMLCWPYLSDQPLNARCIIDEWKVGLGFKASNKEGHGLLIERDEVEKVIRALMEGEEGRVVRQNATYLKQRSNQSFLESGSSTTKLKALIRSLSHCKSS